MGKCSNFYRLGFENTANPDDVESEQRGVSELLGCDTTGAVANPDSFGINYGNGYHSQGQHSLTETGA